MTEFGYPIWKYYPSRSRPPSWVDGVVEAFRVTQPHIDSRRISGTTSDTALAALRPALVALGFDVEESKKKADKIRRPVLFADGTAGAEVPHGLVAALGCTAEDLL